jgi:hypothetical protein
MLTGIGRQQREQRGGWRAGGSSRSSLQGYVAGARAWGEDQGRYGGRAGCGILVRPPPHQAFLRRRGGESPTVWPPVVVLVARTASTSWSPAREQGRRPQPGAPHGRHGRRPPPGSPRGSILFRWVIVQEAGRRCGEDLGWPARGRG